MPKNYYLPTDDSGKAELLEHLAAKLPAYSAVLDINSADLADLQADAIAFRYTLSVFNQMQSNAKQWTAYKNLLRDGTAGTPASTAFPFQPSLPVAPSIVTPGIVPRLTALVARLKAARNYTEAIGKDLNIVGTVQVMEIDEVKPIIEITTRGGQPIIQWSKGDADALEIWVDRNDDRGFGLFTIANSPRITDNTPLPATPVQWKYKAIYRLKDDRIGDWSTITPVSVGG